VPWKGFDMLIKLMPQLKKINSKFKLVIFGDGPMQDKLKDIINENKLTEDVILVGYIPHSQLSKYYQAASLFVLNTGYEGLSHILLDAMYYNIPTIVTNSGGNPELIQNDYNGILVDYNNTYQWFNAIEHLWNNLDLRKQFGNNPLVKLNIFNFNYMAQETIKILFKK
jgi:glycosyltransferase involved in cell wall biosynthesis